MSPSRALAKQPQPAPLIVRQSLAKLEAEIGGRDIIVAALLHAPKSRDLDYLLGILGAPAHAATPLADLCTLGGITPGELIEAYKAGSINRAQALATTVVSEHIPAVAQDTMRQALPHEITCPECHGVGTVRGEWSKENPDPPRETCGTCNGTKLLTVEGEIEHKKLALEMGKLLPKGGGGMNISVNQQVGISLQSAGGALERLSAATDRILYGEGGVDPLVVEADVVAPIASPDPDDPDAPWVEEFDTQ